MTSAVLDASAVLALVRDEPGGDKVIEHVGRAAISAVNLHEVVKELLISGLEEPMIRELLGELRLGRDRRSTPLRSTEPRRVSAHSGDNRLTRRSRAGNLFPETGNVFPRQPRRSPSSISITLSPAGHAEGRPMAKATPSARWVRA